MINGDKGGYLNCNNVWKLLHSMHAAVNVQFRKESLAAKKKKKANHCGIVVILDVCENGEMEIKSTLETRG